MYRADATARSARSATMPSAPARPHDAKAYLQSHPITFRARFHSPVNPEVDALHDTGSNLSVISESTCQYLHNGIMPTLQPTDLVIHGLGTQKALGSIQLKFFIDATVGPEDEPVTVPLESTFFVVANYGPGVGIGLDLMIHYQIDTLVSEAKAVIPTERGATRFDICFARHFPPTSGTANKKLINQWADVYTSAVTASTVTLRAREETFLKPKSYTWVSINQPDGPDSLEWVVLPDRHVDSGGASLFAVQSALTNNRQLGPHGVGLMVTNFGDLPVRLPKGFALTTAEAVGWGARATSCGMFDAPIADNTQPQHAATTFSADAHSPGSHLPFNPLDPNNEEEDGLKRNAAKVHEQAPGSKVNGVDIAHDPLTGQPYAELAEAVRKHPAAFSSGPPGKVKVGEPVRIRLTDEHLLRAEGLRPLGPAKRQVEKEELKTLLEWGIIEKSHSRLGFPVVIVKQGKKMRYCIDYRQLNKHTVPEAYPMQRQDEIFNSLGGMRYFSCADAARGYHQIPIAKEDRHLTAFTTHQGLFQYKYMPFGLRNAPAVFQRFMEEFIICGLRWQSALVYIDDVIIYTETIEEHVKSISTPLENAEKAGLTFSAAKCHLGYPSLQLLGRMISQDGLSIVLDKVKAITDMPSPTDRSTLRSSLGSVGYYRMYILSYARKSEPLQRLLRPNDDKSYPPFEWTATEEKAWNELKEHLTKAPILMFPRPNFAFILYVDASFTRVSVVVHQLFPQDDKQAKHFNANDAASGKTTGLEARLRAEYARDPWTKTKHDDAQRDRLVAPFLVDKDHCLRVEMAGGTRLLLPEGLIDEVLHDFHDRMGHPGIARTAAAINARFFRPKLADRISRHVLECAHCQKAKSSRTKRPGHMDPKDVDPVAFSAVATDIVMGLPRSPRGHECCLLVVCLWTGTVLLAPCKTQLSAKDLADLWFETVTRRGFHPHTITSDQGPQFVSDMWTKLQNKMGTKLVFSAPYHQQANPAERAVQTIETMLRVYCEDDEHKWHNHLSYVELAYNSTPSTNTGLSPFDLLYSSYSSVWPKLQERWAAGMDSNEVKEAAVARTENARQALAIAKARQARTWNDRHRPPPEYKEGDMVLVRLHDRPLTASDRNLHKLRHSKRGPWRIGRVLSRVAVELEVDGGREKPIAVTVDQIEPFKQSTQPATHDNASPPAPAQPETAKATPSEETATSAQETSTVESQAPRKSARNEGRPRRRWDVQAKLVEV